MGFRIDLPPSSGILSSFFAPGLGPRTADSALCSVSLMGLPPAHCPNTVTITRHRTTLALNPCTLRQLESCLPISKRFDPIGGFGSDSAATFLRHLEQNKDGISIEEDHKF